MEVLISNGFISLLRNIFEEGECTLTMCKFLVVILNQIAANGTCTHFFSNRATSWSTDPWFRFHSPSEYHSLLRTGVGYQFIEFPHRGTGLRLAAASRGLQAEGDGASVRCGGPSAVAFPLRVSLQSLLSSCQQHRRIDLSGRNYADPNTGKRADGLCHVSLRTSLLQLFLLLFSYHVADHPAIIQPSTVNQICQRLPTLHNMNVILFLHQFLYYCTLCDSMALSLLSMQTLSLISSHRQTISTLSFSISVNIPRNLFSPSLYFSFTQNQTFSTRSSLSSCLLFSSDCSPRLMTPHQSCHLGKTGAETLAQLLHVFACSLYSFCTASMNHITASNSPMHRSSFFSLQWWTHSYRLLNQSLRKLSRLLELSYWHLSHIVYLFFRADR